MKNKTIVLFVLGLLIVVIVLGVWLIQNGKDNYNNTDTPITAADALNEKLKGNDPNDEIGSAGDDHAISSEDACYEEWLAASMVTAISLTYPDFEPQEILAASETGMSKMEQSEGVYIKFTSNGETIVVHSKPIEKERTKKGTVDLHEEKLGYATFDVVSDDKLDDEGLTAIDMDSLSELITESLLVSIYEHY